MLWLVNYPFPICPWVNNDESQRALKAVRGHSIFSLSFQRFWCDTERKFKHVKGFVSHIETEDSVQENVFWKYWMICARPWREQMTTLTLFPYYLSAKLKVFLSWLYKTNCKRLSVYYWVIVALGRIANCTQEAGVALGYHLERFLRFFRAWQSPACNYLTNRLQFSKVKVYTLL